MKIFDISQEVFSSAVYPGDRTPRRISEKRISDGDSYNLTSFEMCAHNGTHIDAPSHFIDGGDTVEMIPPEKTVGLCYVTNENTDIDKARAESIIKQAAAEGGEECRRILIRGVGTVTADAARVFAGERLLLLGVEGTSVGPEEAPMEVHKILLSEMVVLLEGLRLGEIEEGVYFLSAQPLALGGCDGAPCRAILIEADVPFFKEKRGNI